MNENPRNSTAYLYKYSGASVVKSFKSVTSMNYKLKLFEKKLSAV